MFVNSFDFPDDSMDLKSKEVRIRLILEEILLYFDEEVRTSYIEAKRAALQPIINTEPFNSMKEEDLIEGFHLHPPDIHKSFTK